MKSRMTIGKKVGMLSGALIACCMVVGVAALVSFAGVDRTVIKLTTDAVPGMGSMGVLGNAIYRFRGDAWKHIASTHAAQMAQTESEMGELKGRIEKEMAAYETTIHESDDRANFAELRDNLGRFYDAWQNDVLGLSRQSKNDEAYAAYLKSADPAFQKLSNTVTKIAKWNSDYGQTAGAEMASLVSSTRFLTYCLVGGALFLGTLLSVLMLRGVNHTLRLALSELSQGAAQVASAASQVASSSQSLAQGSSEQAASLEETSASTEEINSMASRNTENSRAAADLVTQSQDKFIETNHSLQEMVGAMGEIKTSSDKISKIIKTIDEIAFQTNILALNAAVEAARAGEAGMGFAVVADEVRNLAQRSAQAAKDTAALIEDSIGKSNEGKIKVDKVAVAIRAITEESATVKRLVDEVNLGSQEQAKGIEQIAKAVTQMEQVTQTTAANAEEGAAAAEELNAQSESLKDIVRGLMALVGGGGAGTDAHAASGVSSLRTAVAPSRTGHVSEPVLDGSKSSKHAFPLDDDFGV
jgi:methyl-accepting chemotaxis protein